jgi:dienelactone hydrolase
MNRPLDGFTRESFCHEGSARTVYRRGSGPPVVVMHEMPGITPAVRRFAQRVADEGYTVFMPHLFGTPGKDYAAGYNGRELLRACVSREFSVFASRRASPITDWLRALCRQAHGELGGKGVGVVGMCITGNFGLALMADPTVIAPVLSQPSLPVGLSRRARSGLHVSEEQLRVAKRRTREEGLRVLGLRFTHDVLCPGARFERLRQELGNGFEAIEIDSSPGNDHGLPLTAHSVLARDFVDADGHPTGAALARVLQLFAETLR